MAIKHVKETLGEFQDHQFFTTLFEGKDEVVDKDEKKLKDEDAKDGAEALQKLRDNLSRFETAAGGKILKYKEFWEENQQMADQFDEMGDVYKLWDSDYVAGVLTLPDEALTDDEINAEIEAVDQAGGDDDSDDETTDEAGDTDDDKDDDKEDDKEDDKDEDKDDDKEDDKKDEKVDESSKPVGEDFPLNEMDAPKKPVNEEDEDEGELPAEDVVTPDEESSEEKEETDQEGFTGFESPGEDLDGDGITGEGEVEVEDGEAIELDGDLDGDGTEEGGMEFGDEGGSSEYFVIYDMSGKDRDEVFRCDDPKCIEDFRSFFENEWKAAIKTQIQEYKQAQEEKKAEAERVAKEKIRAEKKGKLDQFMKD